MTDFAGTYFTCDAVPGWLSRGVDGSGLVWRHIGDITGWDEPPDARSSFTARAQASGSFDAPVYDDNRVVAFTGTVTAPTRAQVEAAKLTIAALGRALRLGATVTGHDEDGDKSVWGRRAPSWKVVNFGPLGLKYQMQLVCPDPYKYGPAVNLSTGLPAPGSGGLTFPLFGGTGKLEFGSSGHSGQLVLSNPGTEDAWPTFTVAGPVLGGLSITDVGSGRQIVYGSDVPAGANLLVIDAAAGRAVLNGADRTGELTFKQWFPVAPDSDGIPAVVQFATLGAAGQTGTLTATVRPTYQ